jgi:hypothetical protein
MELYNRIVDGRSQAVREDLVEEKIQAIKRPLIITIRNPRCMPPPKKRSVVFNSKHDPWNLKEPLREEEEAEEPEEAHCPFDVHEDGTVWFHPTQ